MSSWLVLIIPINFYTLIFITLFLIAYLIFFKKNELLQLVKQMERPGTPVSFAALLYLVISIFLFLILGALKPVNIDTQIYHLQIIRWSSEYGTVPGIANLSPRFGLGSGWFNLISLLHIPFFKTQNYSFLNVSFVSWAFLWLFDKYLFHRKDSSIHGPILALFYFALFVYFMLDWQLFRDAANSTNYDFPVTVFTVIVISFLFEEIMKNKLTSPPSYLFLLFTFTIVSFKFSGVFILFLAGYYLLQKRATKHFLSCLIIGPVLLFPVFIKNYIITGYPFYPLPLSIHKPDWQLPVQLTEGIYRYILNSNRFYNSTFTAEPMESSPFYWAPIWFKGILIQHKTIFFGAIASVIILSFTKPLSGINYKQLKHLMVALALMMAGWFFTAPDPGRFGYGILLPIFLLTVAIFTYRLSKPLLCNATLLVLSFLLVHYTYVKVPLIVKEPKYLLETVEGDQPPFKTIYINGIGVNIPEIINGNWNRRCFDVHLPCSCEENPYLHPRGKSLREGFRMYPQPDSSFVKNYIY